MFRALLAAFAVAMIALGGSVATSSDAEAKTCIRYRVSAAGRRSRIRTVALISARRNWSRRVRRIVGTKYDTWLFSRRKVTKCLRRNRTYRCRVTATPCRL